MLHSGYVSPSTLKIPFSQPAFAKKAGGWQEVLICILSQQGAGTEAVHAVGARHSEVLLRVSGGCESRELNPTPQKPLPWLWYQSRYKHFYPESNKKLNSSKTFASDLMYKKLELISFFTHRRVTKDGVLQMPSQRQAQYILLLNTCSVVLWQAIKSNPSKLVWGISIQYFSYTETAA